jgi:hypothetical protein
MGTQPSSAENVSAEAPSEVSAPMMAMTAMATWRIRICLDSPES